MQYIKDNVGMYSLKKKKKKRNILLYYYLGISKKKQKTKIPSKVDLSSYKLGLTINLLLGIHLEG